MSKSFHQMLGDLRPPRTDIAETLHVWDQNDFSLALAVAAEKSREFAPSRLASVETIWGIPIRVDRTLPAGVCEFRNREGKILLRVEGIAE